MQLPRLRQRRERELLTQGQLAERSGLSRGTIHKLETGGHAMPTTIRKLAQALQCQPRDLMPPEDAHG